MSTIVMKLALILCLALESAASECGLWLAKSSVASAENPTMGMYAGKDIAENSPIGPGELAIQIFHLAGSHTVSEEEGEENVPALDTVEFLESFIWVADASGGLYDKYMGRVVTAIGGIGVLGQYNLKLTNADWFHGSAYHRQALGELPGIAHPGRGSYTDFYNVSMYSKNDIRQGAEIFVDYGENWENEAEDEESDQLQKIDYDRLDKVVDQILEFMEKWKHELDSSSKKRDVYDFIVKDILSAAAGPKKGPKLAALLPSDPEEVYKVKEAGGALLYSEPNSVRDIEWLESNGICLDNIEVGASLIEGAGRGAFATRDLREGSTIAPIPLLHLPEKKAMDIYKVEEGRDEEGNEIWIRDSEEAVGKQLMLNYCFGHPESSVLLFPAGSVVTSINHSRKPNAKLAWSERMFHNKEWLEVSPGELLNPEEYGHIGLMMELVATREIGKGEEVLIDYGPEWQAAWDQHVKDWETGKENGSIPKQWPLRALDLNEQYRERPFPTKSQRNETPLPSAVRQMCFLVVKSREEGGGKEWVDTVKAGTTTINSDNLFDCTVDEVISLDDGSFNYTVQWDNEEDETIKVYNVPHSAIVFVDDADKADEMRAEAFRHHIGIPDDVFPSAWKNLA